MDIPGALLWLFTEVPLATGRDVVVVILGIPLIILAVLRYLFIDIPNARPGSELYLGDWNNVWSLVKQILLFLASLSPIWWVLWGFRGLVIALQNLQRLEPIRWRGWPQQREVAYKGDDDQSTDNLNFFVNGICVDQNWLQLNCKTLEGHLKEKVVGIHNQSYGLFIDLVECILQRDWRFYTPPVTLAAHEVCSALLRVRGTRRKVRLMGHSQGGIIVSLVVDYLVTYFFSEHPGLTQNLEVYTFACAADKFPQVLLPTAPILIQHYGNQFDLVAILGVLGVRSFYTHIVCPLLRLFYLNPDPNNDPRYAGKIFVRKGGLGHLLSTNYVFRNPSPYVPLNGGNSAPF